MSSSSPIRILSVDDHPMLREGIPAVLKMLVALVFLLAKLTAFNEMLWNK